jgi:hypothetical protein
MDLRVAAAAGSYWAAVVQVQQAVGTAYYAQAAVPGPNQLSGGTARAAELVGWARLKRSPAVQRSVAVHQNVTRSLVRAAYWPVT